MDTTNYILTTRLNFRIQRIPVNMLFEVLKTKFKRQTCKKLRRDNKYFLQIDIYLYEYKFKISSILIILIFLIIPLYYFDI